MNSKSAELFWNLYLPHLKTNRKFFELVPEDKYDFKMTPKSDSVRESLAHQIAAMRNYIEGIETGTLEFDNEKYEDLEPRNEKSKEYLLGKFDEAKDKLEQLLNQENIDELKVKTPWGENSAVISLYGLKDHEILHTGWNIALMDHLGIERYDELKENWG